MSATLAPRPAASVLAESVGAGLPRYVLPDQARRIVSSAETTAHRLVLETLWQSGGRISRSSDCAHATSTRLRVRSAWLI
jgi:hypothetical protein